MKWLVYGNIIKNVKISLGTLGNNDDDGYENATYEVNSRWF